MIDTSVDPGLVRCTIQHLKDRLARVDRCFVRGAFVWEIRPRTKLGRAFLTALRLLSNPRPIGRTHRHFLTDSRASQYEASIDPPFQFVCDSNCRSSSPDASRGSRCNDGKRTPKTVLLWYAFKRSARTYIFAKLEGSKGMSLSHFFQAFRKYVLGTSFDGGGYPYRAETVPRTSMDRDRNVNGLLRMVSETHRTASSREKARAHVDEAMRSYDAHVRVGNEMFVPWVLLEREIRTCWRETRERR